MGFLLSFSRILIPLLLYTVISTAQNINPNSSCPSSSCGNIQRISYPFRLRNDPISCGYNNPNFVLDCRNNQTMSVVRSRIYNVEDINYDEFSIRLVDPNINRANLSSCPVSINSYDDWPNALFRNFFDWNVPVVFIHCTAPVRSLNYVNASFCGNRSRIFSNLSEIYSYVVFGQRILLSELEESCTVDRVDVTSSRRSIQDSSSLQSIYNSLTYGFELSWYPVLCGDCERNHGRCSLERNRIRCTYYCYDDVLLSEQSFRCQVQYWAFISWVYGSLALAGLLSLRFICGFIFLVALVVYRWRRRHLSMDKTVEEFLQGQNNLTPIKYTYSEIKKMTNNFSQRLGEGGYGTVYKGKLRSGPYIAVKIMGQSVASEQEFISEVGTIGRINHVNIVQLIGFSVEQRSKCALVYEFLPNGSLDRYIYGEQILGGLTLRYKKMFEIALGVARGIDYLHLGCDMQILHFDIKPHNILLDENFKPKISDFGLAQLYPSNGSVVNLKTARGTMGYMAPEMFYKNIGGISFKADVYSFGMMLMEMVGRRKNMNPFDDDVSQIFFPSWIYDQLQEEKEFEIEDATEEERKMVKKIIIVGLWCIQMSPVDRPSMNKVVEMLEGDYEIEMPPKPFVAPSEIADNHVL